MQAVHNSPMISMKQWSNSAGSRATGEADPILGVIFYTQVTRAVIGYALTPMSLELPEMDFQRFWRRLQQIGLNAYEARSYLVLIGHPRFKALELAARSHVPRQKIYEVLDSLVEKGFAQVIQEKTKLFSAVDPSLAVPG